MSVVEQPEATVSRRLDRTDWTTIAAMAGVVLALHLFGWGVLVLGVAPQHITLVADPRTARLFRTFSRDDDRDTGRGRSVAPLGMPIPTCARSWETRRLKWEADRTRCRCIGHGLQIRFGALLPKRMCRMGAVSQYCDGFF
jgi:hypothetical protein